MFPMPMDPGEDTGPNDNAPLPWWQGLMLFAFVIIPVTVGLVITAVITRHHWPWFIVVAIFSIGLLAPVIRKAYRPRRKAE
jgi:hypothetical protein